MKNTWRFIFGSVENQGSLQINHVAKSHLEIFCLLDLFHLLVMSNYLICKIIKGSYVSLEINSW